MENENKFSYNKNNGVFSKRVRAGRRRTYFFDVRTTRSNDYFLTITESKKRFDNDGYERHKLHLYKEDFNKFLTALQETIDHVKEELMPEYDFDEFTRKNEDYTYSFNNESKQSTDTEEGSVVEETEEPASQEVEEPEPVVEDTPEPEVEENEEDLKWD